MVCGSTEKRGPLVTVVIPTHNRRGFLPVALSSVLSQSYRDLQVIVVRDGGERADDIVEGLRDRRVLFIDRDENLGKAASLNEALTRAEGKYIAYLDDDDMLYPYHVETLVDALESRMDCRLAYTDLYRVYCRTEPDGTRTVLSKVLDISRDFDRFLMLCFNHTLHVSLMHHRDLLDQTGPFNEDLKVLIDWDFTRKAVFFTDFYHIRRITGEFYSPVGGGDRLSHQGRRDADAFTEGFLTIRTTRPAKPWSAVKDLAIIIVAQRFGNSVAQMLEAIRRHTFYPCRVWLPLPGEDVAALKAGQGRGTVTIGGRTMPNVVPIAVDAATPAGGRIDAALDACDGDLVAVAPEGFPVRNFWIEDSVYPLLAHPGTAFELEDSDATRWAVVGTREAISRARRSHPEMALRRALPAVDVAIRRVQPDEIPFQYDQLLEQAKARVAARQWAQAAGMFEHIADRYGNEWWIRSLAANAHYHGGNFQRAGELCRHVNARCPTVETLLLEGRLHRRAKDPASAIPLLEKAVDSIDGRESLWT